MKVTFDASNGMKTITITNVVVLLGAAASLIWNAAVVTAQLDRNTQRLLELNEVQSSLVAEQVEQGNRLTRLEAIVAPDRLRIEPLTGELDGVAGNRSLGPARTSWLESLPVQTTERTRTQGRRASRSERGTRPGG